MEIRSRADSEPFTTADGSTIRVLLDAELGGARNQSLAEASLEPVLRVRLGPRDEWFTPGAVEALVSQPWRVSSSSNRVGIRLEGPHRRADEQPGPPNGDVR